MDGEARAGEAKAGEGDAEGAARRLAALAFRGGRFEPASRAVPEETAVAISVNGSTHAVMMATPRDVEELAVGLALNERIVASPSEIGRIDIAETPQGLDCQLWLSAERGARYTARRRQMTGPVGCGLCGVESLDLAVPALAPVEAAGSFSPAAIVEGVEAMAREQGLGRRTRAVHAAAFHAGDGGPPVVTREDVGRHNALDKVAGYLALRGIDPSAGFITITSRVSVELIQKAAAMGCGLIAAVSAPTVLAVEQAERARITLVAIARGPDFEIFTHPFRVRGAPAAAIALPSESEAPSHAA